MGAELTIAPEALQDVDVAYCWYENQRSGLGEEFLGCLDACIRTTCRTPKLFMKVHEDYRRALIRRFPYAVFYEYADGRVFVYSVFHTSQNPDKWRNRLL